jgi:hypothetical protein
LLGLKQEDQHLAYPATQHLHRVHLPPGNERTLDLGLGAAENDKRIVASDVGSCLGRAAPKRAR